MGLDGVWSPRGYSTQLAERPSRSCWIVMVAKALAVGSVQEAEDKPHDFECNALSESARFSQDAACP